VHVASVWTSLAGHGTQSAAAMAATRLMCIYAEGITAMPDGGRYPAGALIRRE
jgi:hypothetical protein